MLCCSYFFMDLNSKRGLIFFFFFFFPNSTVTTPMIQGLIFHQPIFTFFDISKCGSDQSGPKVWFVCWTSPRATQVVGFISCLLRLYGCCCLHLFFFLVYLVVLPIGMYSCTNLRMHVSFVLNKCFAHLCLHSVVFHFNCVYSVSLTYPNEIHFIYYDVRVLVMECNFDFVSVFFW